MGSDAAGWLHQGMANRLALDMGFNMDPAVLAGAVALPAIEIELRRQIYWALYCHDKLSASYTGRVCTLLVSVRQTKSVWVMLMCLIGLPRRSEKALPTMRL
jgi:hypothetical protein